MTTTFAPPTWQVPSDSPPEPVTTPVPQASWWNALKLAIVAVVVAVAAFLTYNVGHDRGERDAIRACQDATPGIVSGIGRLVGPSGSRLVVCTVAKNEEQ